jgi:hypothetical protein
MRENHELLHLRNNTLSGKPQNSLSGLTFTQFLQFRRIAFFVQFQMASSAKPEREVANLPLNRAFQPESSKWNRWSTT